MASSGLTLPSKTQMMPALAIFRHDMRTLWSSWLVRLWLAGTALLTLLLMGSGWAELQTAPLIALMLFPYLVFPWVLLVMVLGVAPVTGSRVEALADGFLSRPVRRHEYLLASWAARVATVLGVYLVVMVPAVLLVGLADRPAAEGDVTVYGVLGSLVVVGLVLTFLVSLAFLLGTLSRGPLLSLVLLTFFWYVFGFILHTFSLEEFSPISLSQSLPTLLRQPWREETMEDAAGSTLSPKEMEDVAREWDDFLGKMTGREPTPKEKQNFFERGDFKDFSLAKVILGYGLPTLAAVALATACFGWRDL